jgi:actin-related protein
LLKDRGYNFTTPAELEIVRDIKEKLCYVVDKNFDQELKKSQDNNNNDKNYDLPDGRTIVVGDERFKCPEILFQPS